MSALIHACGLSLSVYVAQKIPNTMYTVVVSIYVLICVLDHSTTQLYWFSSMKGCVRLFAFDASPP